MTNIKNQHGNALTGALGMVIFVAIILFLGGLLMLPYQAIDEDKNAELQKMVSAVKDTPFESAFKDKINYYLGDGKISNKEFNKIQDFYSGYTSSKLTGEDKNFSAKAKQDLAMQYKSDEQTDKYLSIFAKFVGFIIILFVIILGFFRITGI